MSCWGPGLIVIGGIFVITWFASMAAGQQDPTVLGVGFVPLVIGILIATVKRDRAIVLATTGGETTALKSKDYALITAIVESLNEAIVRRG